MTSDKKEQLMGVGSPPPRLPELSGAIITKNVRYEIEKLKAAPAWQLPAGRSSETIAKYPDMKIVLVLMKADTRMEKHCAENRTSVYVIQGRIRLHLLEGQVVDLSAGDLLTLDQGIEHDVDASEESAFLLTIAGVHTPH